MSFKSLLAGAAALALFGAGAAHATTWIASGTSSDGALDGQAVITVTGDLLTIQLTDLLADPTSAGQELSGVELIFASGPSSASLTGADGNLITISSGKKGAGNSWKTDTSDTINHWGVATSGDDLYLATAGTGAQKGQPSDLIIDGGDVYTNANSSITGHGPEIQGTGTFQVLLKGLDKPDITGVQLQFGTQAEHTLTASCSSGCGLGSVVGEVGGAVPEPAEWALLITGFFGAGAALRARRRKSARLA